MSLKIFWKEKKMHLFFLSTKAFFFPEYRDTHFRGLLYLKQKERKIFNFLDLIHELNPLEKSEFFELLFL